MNTRVLMDAASQDGHQRQTNVSTTDIATLDALHAVQLVAWFTTEGELQDANGNVLSATGLTLETIQERSRAELIRSHDTDATRAFWSALNRGEPQRGEFRLPARDGGSIWVEGAYVPSVSATGTVDRIGLFGFDVTARKLAKSDSADQMAAIAKSHAVIEFDLDGFILSANGNFLEAVGYDLAEIQGRHHRMFVHEDEANGEVYANFWRQLRNGTFQAGEFSRITKQNNTVWFQASYSPIFNEQGEVTRIVKYATDITRAKAMAEDLQGQIKALSHSQMTIELSLDGTIVTANRNFLETFGYEMSEVQGQHHRMFVTPQEAAGDAYLQFWAKLARGQFQSATYKRIAKGGREVWIQASYNPILDKHGRPFKVVKFATDVTDTHSGSAASAKGTAPQETEAGLKSALMRQSITDAPNGMALLDSMGTFLHINPALCALLGAAPEEVLGQRLDDFLASGAPLFGSDDTSALEQGKTQLIQEERPLQRNDGTEIWTMLHLTRERNSSTGSTAFVLQVQDISERQAAQQLKIDFIATVSHELRTPLTSIKGALGLVLANTQIALDPKVERLVALAMKNSERLASLVNDLLDMEKLSSGQAQFRVSDQSINMLLSQAVAINQPYGTEFGVDYALELPDMDIWIKADADRFHQVLSNLLSNGTKFSPRGSKVRVVCTPSEGSVRVGIIDAGPGVPESFQNKIFQPFSQADSSATRQKGGTGLGLNISRQIVTRMGGKIGFQNLDEGGCEFWFTVPTIKGPDVAATQSAADDTGNETQRILHIEPDSDFAEVFDATLADRFDITHVANIDAARPTLRASRFEAIVIDWNGPDSEIAAFSKELRKLQPHAKLIGLCTEDRIVGAFGAGNFVKGRQDMSVFKAELVRMLA
ncbi:MAG: hypothetical protein CML02_06360 [Pseudooceanicola sp.]|nr:hypothetical protein [Pseudooceanicola sp.]